MSVKLSRLARRDLDDIRRYTTATWGRDQWLKYYRGLAGTFRAIVADPDRGRDRSLFAAGLHSVSYGRHIIFYARISAAGDEPVILRVVHQRRHMPALAYFDEIDG